MTTSSTAPTAVTQFSISLDANRLWSFDEDDPRHFVPCNAAGNRMESSLRYKPTTVHINVAAKYHRALVPVEQT